MECLAWFLSLILAVLLGGAVGVYIGIRMIASQINKKHPEFWKDL